MESVARRRLIQDYYSKRAKHYDKQKSRTWRSSQGFAAEITKELTSARYSGFHVARMKTISCRKSYCSLMEDKGGYFDVSPEHLTACIQTTDADAKKQYGLTDTELTLHYTMIVATKN